jgi:Na+-transporting methylmalonyl-CoA/oxaloacetate decarboxylase gamma subunit
VTPGFGSGRNIGHVDFGGSRLAYKPTFCDFYSLMIDFQTGMQNIVDGQGLSIAAAGMSIVFSALSLISIFIALLPHLLRALGAVFPEATPAPTPVRAAVAVPDDPAPAAAVAAYHAVQVRGAG